MEETGTATHVAQIKGALQRKQQSVDSLIRLDELERITGLKKSAIYAAMAQQRFPASVRISNRSVAWRLSQVMRWVEERPVAYGSKPAA